LDEQQEGHSACRKTERWDAGVVICLGRGADLHMAKLMPMPLSLAPVNPDWFNFSAASRVVPDTKSRGP